jgi:GTPase SAR1 family protein
MAYNFSRESYNHLVTWLNDARALATPELVIVLVGNKTDLQEDREVTFLEASRFAQENGAYPIVELANTSDLMFIETSAKTGENVEEVFVKCAKTILNKIESGMHQL